MTTTFQELVKTIQLLLSCIAILFGGIWGVNEYFEKKYQDRINESLQVVAKLKTSEEYQKYDAFIDSDPINDILHNNLLNGTEKSEQFAKLHTVEIKNQLRQLIDIYKDAVVCVAVNRCDQSAIAAFIAPQAHAINVYSNYVIRYLRERYGNPKYAGELVQVSKWYCTLPKSIGSKLEPALWCPST